MRPHRPFQSTIGTLAILFAHACSGSGVTDNPVPTPTALAVASVAPPNGATAVSATATVTVTFNRAVDPASVTTSSFRVGTIAGTVSATGSTATFTPVDPFPGNSTQTVTVAGVLAADGDPMEGSFNSSFTVVAPPTIAPIANAGPDQTASFSATVTLDASASVGTNRTYVWTQIEGPGVGSITGEAPTFAAPVDIAMLRFELAVSGDGPVSRDTVMVMVLADAANAYFVTPTGDDAAAGSRAAPFKTVQRAMDAADAAGNGGDVYVAAGTYDESLTLRSRVSVYGGFDAVTWRRDLDVSRPVITGARIAVRGTEANALSLDGLRIEAASATEPSESSIGVFLRNSADVVVRRAMIVAGSGFNGTAGATGANRAKADNGNNGQDASVCPPDNVGGSGGTTGYNRNGGTGGTGGLAGGFGGSKGEGSSGGGGGGGGGAFGGNASDGSQSTATRAAGSAGSAGNAFGELTDTDITVATAGAGGGGANGWGGGGGGGGGGGFGCGGGGGGGGAGGQGGGGGQGGTSGGHSIGIALSGETSATITESEITLGAGGNGAAGGTGGTGGAGGTGGNGGANNASGGAGGDGGDGTSGAHGGGGGGARGGWAVAVLEDVNATSERTALTVTPGTPGSGGAGGPRSGGNAGQAGADGQAVDHKKLP